MRHPITVIAATLATASLLIAGCGGETTISPAASEAPTPTDSAPSSAQGQAPPFDASILQSVQGCLNAAGLDVALPQLPAGSPAPDLNNPPSGAPALDGIRKLFADPQVIEALDACGITIPSTMPQLPEAQNP